jgi:hypothetical protein
LMACRQGKEHEKIMESQSRHGENPLPPDT